MNLPVILKQLLAGDVDTQAVSPSAFMAASAPKSIKRAKLWDLNSRYHCPVVGTCLSMDELVKFAKRFSLDVSLQDEYAMHIETVSQLGTRNELSEVIQKHLDRKYQLCLTRFEQAKSDAGVLNMWQLHRASGEVAAAMWSALTHKSTSEETRRAIYADVHMLSHQMGAGLARDARLLTRLEKENTGAKSTLEQERQERTRVEAGFRERIRLLEAGRSAMRAEVAEIHTLRKRLSTLESGKVMVEMGQRLMNLMAANEQLHATAERRWALEKTLEAAHDELTELSNKYEKLTAERDALQRLLPAENTDKESCEGQCSSCDHTMKGRCVLYVGGRSSLFAQYRALAERLGIRLIHHDGGLEESMSRLPDMIKSADAVVCPTDCVSHSAYYQLKRHCKRIGTPYVLFKGTGISSFSAALATLGNPSIPRTELAP